MTVFLPRSRRVLTDLEVAVLLVDSQGGRIVAGPAGATLCNISVTGCCIEIESPLFDRHHIFFDTLDSERHHLEITLVDSSAGEPVFQIAASSVWMNATDEDRPPGFRIGLRFFERQTDFLRYAIRLSSTRP